MTDKKGTIITFILSIIVVVVAGFLGITFGGYFKSNKVVANGIVINSTDTTPTLLKSYTEYNELLKKYKVNDTILLTNNSFNENDYIVDFIDYNKDLEIKDINVEITDEGLNINYILNKEIKESKEKLMYFIPIEKNLINEVKVTDRQFSVK